MLKLGSIHFNKFLNSTKYSCLYPHFSLFHTSLFCYIRSIVRVDDSFSSSRPSQASVMGDLNMSMWSPYYRDFVDRSHLTNIRQGFGIQPSWPVNLPLLQIPIDHCLITSKIKVSNNQIGKDIGSDHYPLIADLVIPKS